MYKYIFLTQVLSTIYVTSIFYQEFVDHTNGYIYGGARVVCIVLMIGVYKAAEQYDKKK